MRIPIEVLKEIAKKYGLSHIIMLAHQDLVGPVVKDHVVTYGRTVEQCSEAADFGNKLKDALGWPESLRTQPSRVLKLQKRIKELEEEIDKLKEEEAR